MKKTIFALAVLCITVTSTFAYVAPDAACGKKECPGGDTKCCTTKGGDTYYINRAD